MDELFALIQRLLEVFVQTAHEDALQHLVSLQLLLLEHEHSLVKQVQQQHSAQEEGEGSVEWDAVDAVVCFVLQGLAYLDEVGQKGGHDGLTLVLVVVPELHQVNSEQLYHKQFQV